MAQVIDLNSRRAVSASKAYSQLSGEPFLHTGNTVLRHEVMVMEEKEEFVKHTSSDSNCDVHEEMLLNYLDGELDQVSRSRVMRHVAGCKSCSVLVDEFRKLKEMSQKIYSTSSLAVSVKSRLRSRLKSELGLKSDLFN